MLAVMRSCYLVHALLAGVAALALITSAERSVAAQAPAGSAETLAIPELGKGTAPIDGKWQFHLGDNMAWAQPGAPDTADPGATDKTGWEQITADDTWGAQSHPSYTGFAWYRKHLHLTPAAGTDGNFSLLIPQIDDAYEVYWNGQLVGKLGSLKPLRYSINAPAKQIFGLGPARDGVLAVRVWKTPLASNDPSSLGGFNEPPLVGLPAAIAAAKAQDDYRWMRSQQLRFTLLVLYALVALVGLLVWRRNRRQYALLALALFCGISVATVVLENLRLPIPSNLVWAVSQPMIGVEYIALWFLLLYLFGLDSVPRVARFTRTLAIVELVLVVSDGLLQLNALDWGNPQWTTAAQIVDATLTAFFLLAQLYVFVLTFLALRRKLDAARWFLAIAAVVDGCVLNIISATAQGQRFTHWTLSEKTQASLFTLNGNSLTPRTLSELLLFIAIVYTVYHTVRETAARQSAMDREMQSARELQQVLIPEELPEVKGYAVTSAYIPAQEVGGDFFQIVPLEIPGKNSTLIVLGDVSGKGLPAAMTVSLLVGAIRTVANFTSSPAQVLSELNARLHGRLKGGFATCVVLRLDADGNGVAATAGHPAPVLNDKELDAPGALPLGILTSAAYEEIAFTLREGDRLALYSDGLLEARDASGEIFSFERLDALFAKGADAVNAADAAVAFGQEDDITVVTLRRLAAGEEARTRLSVPILA